jgi:hypothetical protein
LLRFRIISVSGAPGRQRDYRDDPDRLKRQQQLHNLDSADWQSPPVERQTHVRVLEATKKNSAAQALTAMRNKKLTPGSAEADRPDCRSRAVGRRTQAWEAALIFSDAHLNRGE